MVLRKQPTVRTKSTGAFGQDTRRSQYKERREKYELHESRDGVLGKKKEKRQENNGVARGKGDVK